MRPLSSCAEAPARAAESSSRERTSRACEDFGRALSRASTLRSPAASRRAEPDCPVCTSQDPAGAETIVFEEAGLSLSSRPVDPGELAGLLRSYEGLPGLQGFAFDAVPTTGGASLTATPATVLQAPTETAAALASFLVQARDHLDRHRRFALEISHPVHGTVLLTGSLKGERMQVAFEAAPSAHRHLSQARPHLQEALARAGLDLVSFLPGAL